MGVGAVGIISGAAAVPRIFGETWPFGLAVGSLLQAKGLTELVVLSVLLDVGIVSASIFAPMVLIALESTAIAMPLSRLIVGQSANPFVSLRVTP
jgi:Kef-type K+ transport system membrane component KefB